MSAPGPAPRVPHVALADPGTRHALQRRRNRHSRGIRWRLTVAVVAAVCAQLVLAASLIRFHDSLGLIAAGAGLVSLGGFVAVATPWRAARLADLAERTLAQHPWRPRTRYRLAGNAPARTVVIEADANGPEQTAAILAGEATGPTLDRLAGGAGHQPLLVAGDPQVQAVISTPDLRELSVVAPAKRRIRLSRTTRPPASRVMSVAALAALLVPAILVVDGFSSAFFGNQVVFVLCTAALPVVVACLALPRWFGAGWVLSLLVAAAGFVFVILAALGSTHLVLSARGEQVTAAITEREQVATGRGSTEHRCSLARDDGTAVVPRLTGRYCRDGDIGQRLTLMADPDGQVEPVPMDRFRQGNPGTPGVIITGALLVLLFPAAALRGTTRTPTARQAS